MNALNLLNLLFILISSVLAQETSNSTNAPIIQNNPARVTYQAVLQTDKPVQGQITGVSNDNGTGVNFNVNFFNFPDISAGPFLYHIHEYPVDAAGNCTTTGGHLSPYGRTETPACDASAPGTCQPGDLSGKHGNISQLTSSTSGDNQAVGTFQAMYLDLYLSTDASSVAFFGNRSVVVHAGNGTRLNCGNFTQMMPSNTFGGNVSNTTTASGTATPTHNAAVNVMQGHNILTTGIVVLAVIGSFI